jgi:nucleotidyltransferase substrate binding protein (TIGR01987 family)
MEQIRWKQRFNSLKKAYAFLSMQIPKAHRDDTTDVALIKAYEMAFELAWKTLQDFMQYQGIQTLGARDAIKAAFGRGLVIEGQMWIEMLDQRNMLVHIYDQKVARAAVNSICQKYYPLMTALIEQLGNIHEAK